MGGRVDPREIFSINPTPPPPTVRDLPLCACVCVGVSLCHCRVNEVVSQLAGPGDQHLDPRNRGALVNKRLVGSGGDGSPPSQGGLARNSHSRRSHAQNSSSCKGGKKEKLKLRQPDIFCVHLLAILIDAPCQHRATF